jgi:uncharacterized protein (TIGR02246 family)
MGMLFLAMWSALASPQAPGNTETGEIRALLGRQEQDWNRGDVAAFMDGYARTGDLVFTTGGEIYRGWDGALARYKANYPDRAAMGKLTFTDTEITILGPASAMVLGKWALQRAEDKPHGVFTIVLRKGPEGWRIIHDHTSSSRR